jgi:hypothetical protein
MKERQRIPKVDKVISIKNEGSTQDCEPYDLS